MSYTMIVTFRCDGCGITEQMSTTSVPIGWMQPGNIFGQAAGPHFCPSCVTIGLQHRAALVPVPVEYKVR